MPFGTSTGFYATTSRLAPRWIDTDGSSRGGTGSRTGSGARHGTMSVGGPASHGAALDGADLRSDLLQAGKETLGALEM